MTSHLNLDTLTLHHGAHNSPADGLCLLEAVALFANEPTFSDRPACVSPVLASFGRSWNDGMRTDQERDQLKRYIPLLVGTAGHPDIDERAAWMSVDWLARVHAVAWLRLANLEDHADALAGLPEVTADTIAGARSVIDAAWDAAGDAVRDAAGDAAWDAAGDAARDAAGAAAWDAAGDAARDAAGDAARDAAWAAARAAAWAALEPTVRELQESAHDLFSRMIDLYPRDRELVAS